MTTFIGIDFSINSPAICIENNEEFKFFGIVRGKQTKVSKFASDYLNGISGFEISYINEMPNIEYSSNEFEKIKDAKIIVDRIINIIKNNAKGEIIKIGIEGFSYGSTGNKFAEIVGYSYLLRNALFENGYIFYIYAPSTIKKIAGKGNFNKEQMIDSFFKYKKPNNLNKIFTDEFKKIMKPSKKWLKPFEDMVDAFFIVETLKNKNEMK